MSRNFVSDLHFWKLSSSCMEISALALTYRPSCFWSYRTKIWTMYVFIVGDFTFVLADFEQLIYFLFWNYINKINTFLFLQHAHALEILSNHLKEGSKALDVGSGSGYLTACMALMVSWNEPFCEKTDHYCRYRYNSIIYM